MDTNVLEVQAVAIFKIEVWMLKDWFGFIGRLQERSSLRFARWAEGIELSCQLIGMMNHAHQNVGVSTCDCAV